MLLYDGTCGFCARSVQFMLRHERRPGTLRFATLEGPFGHAIRAGMPTLGQVDSAVWYDPHWGAVLTRSDAVVAALRYLGGAWRWAGAALWRIPKPLRNAGYDFVARHRHRIAGRTDVCPIPTAEQRVRFLG